MKLMRKKFKVGIFHQLLGSYVIFSVLLIVSFIITMFVVAMGISKGQMNQVMPSMLVDQEGHIGDLSSLSHLGGWIEVLDAQYQTIEVYGAKQTDQRTYTPSDLYQILSIQEGSKLPYVGFLTEVQKPEGIYYYIVFVSRSAMTFKPTLLISADNELASWAPIVVIVFFALFGLNCVLLSVYLSRKIKKPLRQIVGGMKRVKQGEQQVRLDFQTEAEFEEIRDTFNTMIATIVSQNLEKSQLEQKKNKMLLELSHDIKTPIATIKSYAKALDAGLVAEEKKQGYYQTIDHKADRVCHLAEDLFMMLKMDHADYQLQKVRGDAGELLRQICVEYYDEVESAGLVLEPDIPEEAYWIQMDEHLIGRVLGNLMTNAIKYNRTGSQVSVSIHHVAESLEICVLDDGACIQEEMRVQLFEAFSRGDRARKTDGGTGLGLAIAKAIVEKHDGRITYEVREQMNCFKIDLPVT
ncbi:MAG: ATP-binding protein [Cellulosilyticaceae bacterium]